MTKSEFINFVVMRNWNKRQLLKQFLKLVMADLKQKYKPIRKRVRYIVMGSL